jgi:hypothetical protein
MLMFKGALPPIKKASIVYEEYGLTAFGEEN